MLNLLLHVQFSRFDRHVQQHCCHRPPSWHHYYSSDLARISWVFKLKVIIGLAFRWESSPRLLYEKRSAARMQRRTPIQTQNYTNLCVRRIHSLPFGACMENWRLPVFPQNEIKLICRRMHASVIRGVIFHRYWHSNFYFELNYYELGARKCHHFVCFPAIVIPGRKSTMEGKMVMQKHV